MEPDWSLIMIGPCSLVANNLPKNISPNVSQVWTVKITISVL